MNHKKSAQYLLAGMVSFFLLVTICISIRPVGLIVNSGISYYANYISTLVPYALAILINSALMWHTASLIGDKTNNKIDICLKFVLKTIAILMIGILLTPHHVLDSVHRGIGTTIFSLQMIMGIIIVAFAYHDWINILLLIIATISGYAAIIYLLQPTGFMIEAQIVFQVSIWSLYIRYLKLLK